MSDPGDMFDWDSSIGLFKVGIMLLIALLLGGLFALFGPWGNDKKK